MSQSNRRRYVAPELPTYAPRIAKIHQIVPQSSLAAIVMWTMNYNKTRPTHKHYAPWTDPAFATKSLIILCLVATLSACAPSAPMSALDTARLDHAQGSAHYEEVAGFSHGFRKD